MNIKNILETKSSSSIGSLYPKTVTVENEVKIVDFLKGVGIKRFYTENNYCKFEIYKTDTEGNEMTYSNIISDFIANEKATSINVKYILSAFMKFYPEFDINQFSDDVSTLEQFISELTTLCPLPTPINEEVYAKIVFRADNGEKPRYNLSKNYPFLSDDKNELSFKDGQYGDKILFTIVKSEPDNLLSNTLPFDNGNVGDFINKF